MKYDDLTVWQKGLRLVKEIYQERKDFPEEVGKVLSGLNSFLQKREQS